MRRDGHREDALNREHVYDLKRQLFRIFESANPGVDITTARWGEFVSRFGTEPAFVQLRNMDKLDVYEDFMMERLEHQREEARKTRRREARKKREKYLLLLEQHKDELAHEISWPDFVSLLKHTDQYKDLIGTRSSSQPYDLFAEMRSRWKRDQGYSKKRSRSSSPRQDASSKRPKE